MYAALAQHDGVFMPRLKEPAFFCSDLDEGVDIGGMKFIRDAEEYLRLFADAPIGSRVGEACVLNLYSEVAARRIHAANPGARIIVHVRDPVEQMHSWHAFLVTLNVEPISEFRRALEAEAARHRVDSFAVGARPVHRVARYRSFAAFRTQIGRYFEVFGRSRVQVVVLEDLAARPKAVLSDVLTHLDLNQAFEPHIATEWPNRGLASRQLFDWMRSPRVVGAAKKVVPHAAHSMASRLSQAIHSWNVRPQPRQPMDATLRDSLRAEMYDEVSGLSELLERDLANLWWGSTARSSR